MADNVNIIVQDTINDIVVNAAVIVETIDINVQAAVDEVQIIANPNNYVVNINRIIGEQVQSDWDQADDQAPDYIKNKPSIPTLTSDLTNDGEDGINPFITAADVTPQVNSDWDATSGVAEILNKPTIPAAVTKTSDLTNDGEDGINPFITAADIPAAVTSVGLTMPSAFSVANSPITSAGTLEVTGAGLVSQYVRGDGSLANFPTSTGGGSSLAFYLNGSVSQGTFGGVAFKEMDRTPILGAGTDFTIAANGYIQSFITDANVPNLLEIPAGNWNFETYFSSSSNGGSPSFYVELYKWDGTTLSLIASNSANPEGITNGTATHLYLSALPVPQTTLALTDRLAVRIYVNNSGRTIKLHTENGHLCEVITTFSTGLTALNGLTAQVQSFATGTSGTDFAISSTTATHTFNLPTASAANRGALSSTDWSTFNGKFTLPALTSGSVLFSNGTTIAQDNANLFWDDTNNRLGIGIAVPSNKLHVSADTNSIIGLGRFENTNVGTAVQSRIQLVSGTASAQFGLFGSGHSTNPRLFRISGSSDGGDMYLATGGIDRFAITIGGNVLINTTTDAGYKLDVNGTARVQNQLTTTGSITAASAIARGVYMNQTLVAAANSDILVGLDIAPTFTNGSFTGVKNYSIRVPNGSQIATAGAASYSLYLAASETALNAPSGILQFQIATLNVGRFFSSGNLTLQNGGTFTDAGFRLDVNGTVRIKAQGALSTDIAFRVRNSADTTNLFNVNGNGRSEINGSLRIISTPSAGNIIRPDDVGTAFQFGNGVNTAYGEFRFKDAGGTDLARITTTGSFSIGANAPNTSAKLDIQSTTQGFLPPRMTNAQRLAIATPAIGLMVYCTDVVEGLYINKSTGWTFII
jgi:hypothetical protein